MPPNPPAGKPAPKTKGKPLGIPTWGWIAAIAIGLVVGYVVLKKSGSSTAATTADQSSGSSPSPLGDQTGAGGGGIVAVPPPPSITPVNVPGSTQDQGAGTVPFQDQTLNATTASSSSDNQNPMTINPATIDYARSIFSAPQPEQLNPAGLAYARSVFSAPISTPFTPVTSEPIPATPTGTGGGYIAPSSYLLGNIQAAQAPAVIDYGRSIFGTSTPAPSPTPAPAPHTLPPQGHRLEL